MIFLNKNSYIKYKIFIKNVLCTLKNCSWWLEYLGKLIFFIFLFFRVLKSLSYVCIFIIESIYLGLID